MKRFLPALSWIPNYKKEYFSGDLSAGLTVGVMLIPQGMAYAMLAGLPPIYGLYAATVPLFIYALFGTSPQLAVGPVALVSLLIYSGIGVFAEVGSPEFIAMAILLAAMVGVILLLMGLLRLGFLVNFISHPVIAGFTSAAAIIIAISQLKHLLGLDIGRGRVHEIVIELVGKLSEVNLPTMLIGTGALAMLLAVNRINKKIPGPLIAVFLGILSVFLLGLDQQGVNIVKEVPAGLDLFGIPEFKSDWIKMLFPFALTIAFIGFLESIAVAKALQAKHKDYDISANQELIGLGLANIIGSFFKAFPVMGGFGRSAVNDQAGSRTGLASMISGTVIIITLLFFTQYFYYLPQAVLGAIIFVAVLGLIDIKEAKHLWATDRKDFWLFVITAIGTLTLGVEEGIVFGVVLSLAILIYKVSYPHIAVLGRVPGTDHYRNVARFEGLQTFPDKFIFRFDAQLYFANSNYFKDFVQTRLASYPDVRHIVFDVQAVNDIDSSAIHMLETLLAELRERGIDMHFASVKGPVRDILKKNRITDLLGEEHFHMNLQNAIDFIDKGIKQSDVPYAMQSDFTKGATNIDSSKG